MAETQLEWPQCNLKQALKWDLAGGKEGSKHSREAVENGRWTEWQGDEWYTDDSQKTAGTDYPVRSNRGRLLKQKDNTE